MIAAALPYAFALLAPFPVYVLAMEWRRALPLIRAMRAQIERIDQ